MKLIAKVETRSMGLRFIVSLTNLAFFSALIARLVTLRMIASFLSSCIISVLSQSDT